MSGEGVHHHQPGWRHGGVPYGGEYAEFVEGEGSVRGELQAGAYLAEAGGSFHESHAVAGAGGRQCGCQSADAAADHGDVEWGRGDGHLASVGE